MPEPLTITVDAKGMPQPAVDPNVKVPDRVKAAAEAANNLHQQAYSAAPVTVGVTEPTSSTSSESSPTPAPVDDRANWGAAEWQHHAKSMEGRFKQANEQVTTLQGTVTELGDELVRTQAAARPAMNNPPPQYYAPPPIPPVQKQLTQEDVNTYGDDFLNVAQRAALDAVMPRINTLEQRNQQLERQLTSTRIQTIENVLDTNIPNWPQINKSPRFHAWLALRDFYSNRLRKELLNQAHQAADAARVLRFFQGFLQEEEATGQTEFLPNKQPPQQAAPVQPVVELNTLTAPGHARPAVGTQTTTPAGGDLWITRDQIKQFYVNVRKGVYNGRQQDYANDQAIIFECQRTGRIR